MSQKTALWPRCRERYVRFGSLAGNATGQKMRFCPLLSESDTGAPRMSAFGSKPDIGNYLPITFAETSLLSVTILAGVLGVFGACPLCTNSGHRRIDPHKQKSALGTVSPRPNRLFDRPCVSPNVKSQSANKQCHHVDCWHKTIPVSESAPKYPTRNGDDGRPAVFPNPVHAFSPTLGIGQLLYTDNQSATREMSALTPKSGHCAYSITCAAFALAVEARKARMTAGSTRFHAGTVDYRSRTMWGLEAILLVVLPYGTAIICGAITEAPAD